MKLGTFKFGEKKDFSITFTNTGENDFSILHIQGACTCTQLTDYPKGAIKPGAKGTIKFTFDSGLADIQKGYNSGIEIYGNIKDDLIIYELEADVTE